MLIRGEWNMDEAIEVWKEEAREEEREETAKSMLKEGLDVVLIERITKLPQKEILALR
jgi:predicted RNase H-like HicB family nuclease